MTADPAVHQKACAKLLGTILDRVDAYKRKTGRVLPTLVWSIGFDGMTATVDEFTSNGLFASCTQREAFDWWAEMLGAEPVADRIQSDGRRFLSAVLRTNGTAVVLRTLLPAPEVQS